MRAAIEGGARPEADRNLLYCFLRVGPRRLPLEDGQGRLTQHGRLYQELARQLDVDPSITAWRPGTQQIGRDTVAYLLDGTQLYVRRWDPHNNREIQTPNGNSYYAQFRDEFLVNIPAIRHAPKKEPSNDRGTLFLPISGNHIGDVLMKHPELAGIGRVPANADLPQQQQWIRDAVQAYLNAQPRDENGEVILSEFSQSEVWFTWDEHRGTTFDEVVNHVHNPDAIHDRIQAILDRPLQGIPIVPDEMYDKQGCTPIAWEDLQSRGGCILNQLVMVLNKRVKKKTAAPGDRAGGSDTRKVTNVWEPMFTMEQITLQFQAIFDRLYPGRTATIYGPKTLTRTVAERRELEAAKELYRKGLGKRPLEEPPEDTRPVRAAPYHMGDWREIGITCELIKEFARWQ